MLIAILGSSHAELPLVRAVAELGHTSLLLSGDSKGKAIGEADLFEPCDYSSSDAVLSVVQRTGAIALVAGCNDFAAITAARVSSQLGFPGYDDPGLVEMIHTKDRFRLFCKSIGIPTPNSHSFDNLETALEYVGDVRGKQICKPVDLTGGKGVAVISGALNARETIGRALALSRKSRVVLEDFIEGSLHSLCVLIKQQKPVFAFFADEVSYPNPFLVSAAVAPSVLKQKSCALMIEYVSRIAESMEMVDGVFHLQFIETDSGPMIIDVCRRPPGDLYLQLVKNSTGFDISREIVNAALGQVVYAPKPIALVPTLRQCLMVPKNGECISAAVSSTYRELEIETTVLRETPTVVWDYMVEKLGIGMFQCADSHRLRDFMQDFGVHYVPVMNS
jgi:biotin carboxylase